MNDHLTLPLICAWMSSEIDLTDDELAHLDRCPACRQIRDVYEGTGPAMDELNRRRAERRRRLHYDP